VRLRGVLEAKKFKMYQNANMPSLTSGKMCYITKYFQRKLERKRREGMSLQRFVILEKLIASCYLEVYILINAESFFIFFKEGAEEPDDDTPAHFVSHSAYFARRAAEVNGVACSTYFFNLPRFQYVL